MGKNYMPEVAQMLGVEVGEPFDILLESGEIRDYSPYKFTNETMVDCVGDEASNWMLFGLLRGNYTIKKRPWRPKYRDEYWIVTTDGSAGWRYFRKDHTEHLANLNMGNCFPTEEAAEAAVPEMLAKFEEIKKEVEE